MRDRTSHEASARPTTDSRRRPFAAANTCSSSDERNDRGVVVVTSRVARMTLSPTAFSSVTTLSTRLEDPIEIHGTDLIATIAIALGAAFVAGYLADW